MLHQNVTKCKNMAWLWQDGAVGNLNSMEARNPLYQRNMGQRVELSFNDARSINQAYCMGTHHQTNFACIASSYHASGLSRCSNQKFGYVWQICSLHVVLGTIVLKITRLLYHQNYNLWTFFNHVQSKWLFSGFLSEIGDVKYWNFETSLSALYELIWKNSWKFKRWLESFCREDFSCFYSSIVYFHQFLRTFGCPHKLHRNLTAMVGCTVNIGFCHSALSHYYRSKIIH